MLNIQNKPVKLIFVQYIIFKVKHYFNKYITNCLMCCCLCMYLCSDSLMAACFSFIDRKTVS